MRHAVLGLGNLGLDIELALKSRGSSVMAYSQSSGWVYPGLQTLESLVKHLNTCDHVWVSLGAGSVEGAIKDYGSFADLHVKLPVCLAQQLDSRVGLHLFSTDYVMVQGLYSLSKRHMEQALLHMGRKNTRIYRISSLYGLHKPEQCFPYKLKKNSLKGAIKLPLNYITPTPTDWLAEFLTRDMFERYPMSAEPAELFTVSPTGAVTVRDWGNMILTRQLESSGVDESRPRVAISENIDFKIGVPSWYDLWSERKDVWIKVLEGVK